MAKRGIIFLMISLCLLTPSAYAVGIWSVDMGQTITFEPYLHKEINYKIHSTTDFPQDFEFYAGGELAKFIRFEPQSVTGVAPHGYADFKAIVDFGPAIDKPGIYRINIGVRELVLPGASGPVARTAAEDAIILRVLYPEPLLTASLNIPDGNVNELLLCTISLENLGSPDIDSAKAAITIYDSNNLSISSLETDTTPVKGGETAQLTAQLDTSSFKPGEYYGKARVYWGNNETIAEDSFRIGNLSMNIVNYTTVFEKNKVNPFEIIIESGWNNPINDIYAIVEFPNEKVQTPSISIVPWQRARLASYWDSTPLEPGEYNATINLHYLSQSKKYQMLIQVIEKAVERKPSAVITISSILLIILIILIIFNILLRIKQKRSNG